MTDILIVEDNEELGALIRDFLVRDGFTVTWKTTGEDGLSALKEDRYRLMLLDVMLPGFDGYESLKHYIDIGRQQSNFGKIIEINANDFSYQTDEKMLFEIDKFMDVK